MDRLEDLVVDVSERVMSSPFAHLVLELNPNFVVPKKPFKRMNYSDAIVYLKENGITKDDGTFYEFGEVLLYICVVNAVISELLFTGYPRNA